MTDSGPGIPAARRAEVFEPFVRGSGVEPGVRARAWRSAAVWSRPTVARSASRVGSGEGTHVRGDVPCWSPSPWQAAVSTDGQRVLVVDDEPQIVRALKVILRGAGYATDSRPSPSRRRWMQWRSALRTRWCSTWSCRTAPGSRSARRCASWSSPADHRPLGGRRRAREGPGARRRRRRLHHQAVRDRRAAGPAARGAAAGRRRRSEPRDTRSATLAIDLRGAPGLERRRDGAPHADRVRPASGAGPAPRQARHASPAPARGLGAGIRGRDPLPAGPRGPHPRRRSSPSPHGPGT